MYSEKALLLYFVGILLNLKIAVIIIFIASIAVGVSTWISKALWRYDCEEDEYEKIAITMNKIIRLSVATFIFGLFFLVFCPDRETVCQMINGLCR